ncbi:hypothetical protein [Cognatilysobacter bugurensis]|uniref:Outer membrane protein beta-barrel domain-containing protein n=1 Tax=Cognatilysobacter bugurensis TaxID=543356 RepID=A0A918T3I6_9GAMM|nr:hypothetical protein [Lysobacter bugurensis]GHA90316.1 hypothetical protein GCM10007067_30130 [Lysobacter bugurensis]
MARTSARFLLPLALLVAPAAHAVEIGYNVVELGVIAVDGVSSGPTARVAAEFGDSGFYGSLGATRQSLRDGGHVDAANAGLGYAYTLADGLDLNTELGVQRSEADGVAADAYRASLGVTSAPSAAWLLTARANRYFGGDLEAASTSAAFGAEYFLTPRWSVATEVEIADGPDAALFALHWGF